MKLNCFLTSIFLFVLVTLQSQVTGVKYQMKYNQHTKQFDVYMNVVEGNAYLSKHRIQFNSQISIVAPSSSVVSIVENYMPLQLNADYKGTKPSKWNLSNSISNASSFNGNSIYGIIPSLTPTPFYNDLNTGDEVKLFSLKITPLPTCNDEVRFYDNEKDARSTARDLLGADFSNGFTIGGSIQLYKGNIETENPFLPKGDLIMSEVSVNENDVIKLFAGNWENASTYRWNGPNGFVSNEKNPVINAAKLSHSGLYTLTIASEQGCTINKEVKVNVSESVLSDVEETTLEGIAASVFPNPATEYINITVKGNVGSKVSASIYDITGKEVMSNVINQKMVGTQIEKNVPIKFNPGIYTVKVKVDNKESEHKFICVD